MTATTVTNQTAQPDHYWDEFGLVRAPFEESAQYAMYYPLPQWQERLDFLKYISRSNKALIAISGVPGSGKSMLVAQYLGQIDPEIHNCLLKASSTLSAKQLLDRIAVAFDIKENISDLMISEQADAVVTHLEQRHINYVLLIDDAHRLPLETLSCIIELATRQQENTVSLYIILSGEPQMSTRLQNLLEISEDLVNIEQFVLRSLSLEETKGYIKYRLIKSGLTGTLPFSDELIEHIYELSGGVPGRINRFAHQAMLDVGKIRKELTHVKQWRQASHFVAANYVKIISLCLLVTVGYVLWHYFARMDQQLLTKQNTVANVKTNNVQVQKKSLEQVIAEHTRQAVQLAQANVQANVQANANAQTRGVVPEQLQSGKAQETTKIAVNTQATSQTLETNANANANTQAPSKALSQDFQFMEKRLLNMHGYALQLAGVRKSAQMHNFINQNGLRTKALYFRTSFKNKPWFVVLYGQYATASQAKAAIATLPPNLQRQKPWVRSFKSIQSAINANS